MNVKREIRVAVRTGKATFGVKEALEHVDEGDAEILIVAKNCPEERFKTDEYKGVPVYHYEGINQELGSTVGKPFAISTIAILDGGESNILSLKAE